jgi:hypothetical protein
MEPLITMGGYDFPEPSTYSATTATIVDAARNVQGKTVGSVVRLDVAKIEVTWRYLTVEQWATILSMFSSSFYNSVRFFCQTSGAYEVREFYVSDRTAGMWRRHPETGAVMGWTNCSLNLIEV